MTLRLSGVDKLLLRMACLPLESAESISQAAASNTEQIRTLEAKGEEG